MLSSSNFKEGRELQENGSVEVVLQDDDPTAMGIMADILHLDYDEVPNAVSMAQLWDVAQLIDKYDAAKAVKPMVKCWIQALLATADDEARQALLVVAYRVQHSEEFALVGKEMAMKNRHPMLPARGTACGIEIPTEMTHAFSECFELFMKAQLLMLSRGAWASQILCSQIRSLRGRKCPEGRGLCSLERRRPMPEALLLRREASSVHHLHSSVQELVAEKRPERARAPSCH